MQGLFDKRKLTLIVALFLVAVLAISVAGGRHDFLLLRGVLTNILTPANIFLNSVGGAISNAVDMMSSFMHIYDENEALKQEIAGLRRDNTDVKEILAENERLRALLNFKRSQKEYVFLPARVVGLSPGGIDGFAFIDRGRKDGIERNMAVVTIGGLVGNVVEVYSNSSRVQLLLHPNAAVGGIVQRPASRVSGVVSGNASTPGTPNLLNLARDADVLSGDTVLTSGYGSIYPKGIVIGTVSDVVNVGGGLLKYAVIEPVVDFSRLEEVLVITNAVVYEKEGTPATEKAVTES